MPVCVHAMATDLQGLDHPCAKVAFRVGRGGGHKFHMNYGFALISAKLCIATGMGLCRQYALQGGV
jgi:hypothetical protein